MTGCLTVETYLAIMEKVGFVKVHKVRDTNFWTSECTRGVEFIAEKPMGMTK